MKGKYTMKAKTLMNAVLMAAIATFLGVADAEAFQRGGGACSNRAIQRLDANFDFFGETQTNQTATDQDPKAGVTGGIAVYKKEVFVPSGVNTMYVTLSSTGDTHNGAASWFTCLVDNGDATDGTFCTFPDSGASFSPPGWITLQKLPAPTTVTNCNDGLGGSADCHDNGIYYQWCVAIEPGVHNVEIRMATSSAGDTVFIEDSHFYVDASCIVGTNKCTQKIANPKGN